MKISEKYSVIKKGIGQQIFEEGNINYFGFFVIRKKWFFNLLYNDIKYYVINDIFGLRYSLSYKTYYLHNDDVIEHLNIVIELYFNNLKSNNILSYKETIL